MKTMRDEFLHSLSSEMKKDEKIILLSVDFGAPVLDKIRIECKNQIINTGIAEQNAINLAAGFALEGFKVFVYGISPFISMRCFEQIRINLAALSQLRKMNVNIISIGAGISYSMSGPTHHCLEDLNIINTLPNIEIFSPSDPIIAELYLERALKNNGIKYLRFDAKALNNLSNKDININKGFRILNKGDDKIAIIATGYMSQKAYTLLKDYNFTLIDLFLINSYDKNELKKCLDKCKYVISLEESFGGLDAEINSLFKHDKKLINLKFQKKYNFEIGDREFLHSLNKLSIENIKEVLDDLV
ncbi:transketolase [uncultured Campylobacter sp.]|uniref:transketolase family protein n=1 Tax=uncultured Campylobacter sp. TaxID=218934 RepID=UPI0026268963|nr:transketolase [uncultured Campylobacter sp.]